MAHACNLSPGEVEAGGSGVQSQPQLHSESEVSLDSMRAGGESGKEEEERGD